MVKSNFSLQELESTLAGLQRMIEAKDYKAEVYYSVSRTLWRTPFTFYLTVDILDFEGQRTHFGAYGDDAIEKLTAEINEFISGPKDEQ